MENYFENRLSEIYDMIISDKMADILTTYRKNVFTGVVMEIENILEEDFVHLSIKPQNIQKIRLKIKEIQKILNKSY